MVHRVHEESSYKPRAGTQNLFLLIMSSISKVSSVDWDHY